MTVVGALQPRSFTVVRTATFRRPPADVWRVITDFAGEPGWRPRVARVERAPDRNGRPAWDVTFRNDMRITMVTGQMGPGRHMARRITGASLPFTGVWTYDVTPAPGGARLT